MEIADLVALSERLGAPVRGPEIARRALVATRFGAASPSDAGRTRLGGAPELPPGTAWPRYHGDAITFAGKPMTFVAQIDLASLPERRDRVLAGEGLLSLFCLRDPDSGEAPGPAWVAHHPTYDLALIDYPPDLDDTDRLPEVPLRGVPELTIPDQQAEELAELGLEPGAYDEPAEHHRQLVEELAKTQDLPSGHRLLGHPNIVQHDPLDQIASGAAHELQDPALGEACWRLLLQVDGLDAALGCETLYFALPGTDLRAGRFDRVRAIADFD